MTVCRQCGVDSLEINARNVGAARAVGFQALIGDEPNPAALWLASTDADSQVEPTWLRQQLRPGPGRSGRRSRRGPPRPATPPAPSYARPSTLDYQKHLFDDGTHNHVHGANLGLRASVYLRAGGFPTHPQPRGPTPHPPAAPHPRRHHHTKPAAHRLHQRPAREPMRPRLRRHPGRSQRLRPNLNPQPQATHAA